MGHDLHKALDPDMAQVARNLSSAAKPCSMELLSYMDCIKRNAANDADKSCARENAALTACAGRMSGGPKPQTVRKELMQGVQKLLKNWKKFGY